MSEFEEMSDHDERCREPRDGEYTIPAIKVGRIVCCRPGMRLIDFYRTSSVLTCDLVPSGAGGVQGVNPSATPPEKVGEK